MSTPILDSHVHLIDPERMSYPWLPAGDALHQRWDAAQYGGAAPGITGAIAVEAGVAIWQADQEIAFVRGAGGGPAGICGIVAQPSADDIAGLGRVLPGMIAHDFVAGVCRNLRDEPPGFLREIGLAAGIRQLGEAELPFDASVRAWQCVRGYHVERHS